jgi:hypothetical protein
VIAAIEVMEVRQVKIVLLGELYRDLKRRGIEEAMPLKELPAKFTFTERR